MPTPDSLSADTVTKIYRDHHGWLSGWLRKKLGNSFDAADLAHDTFVRLMAGRRPGAGAGPRARLTHNAQGLVGDHRRPPARG
ncbi:MAG: RNA polymerase subunit sigma, partial [Achromobacter sp.]|uniref:sigma factor n=1 Tax=Achromobacter sp. TaxID=134375 RepID=UPI00258E6A4B